MPTAVSGDELAGYVEQILRRLGARDRDAGKVARALVEADRAGHASHGVRQLPYYADQVRRGEIRVDATSEVVEDRGAMVVVDGGFGFGHVVAEDAAELAGERALRHGVAAVAVRHANHIGRLGGYTELLAAAGRVAILLVNCEGSGQQLAPFGGIDRRLTNNPISLAVPGPEHPIVLDMALSAVAESRVLHALERGEDVPDGWVLDAAGEPTTSPAAYVAGGTLVPVGGLAGAHKGYALIMLVELVVGLLSGGRMCGPGDHPFSNGFVLICAEPGGGVRGADVASVVDWVKSARLREGFREIVVPGETEARVRRSADGTVRVDASTVALLEELGAQVGVGGRLSAVTEAAGTRGRR